MKEENRQNENGTKIKLSVKSCGRTLPRKFKFTPRQIEWESWHLKWALSRLLHKQHHLVNVMYLSCGTVFTSLKMGLIIFLRWLIWCGDISRQKLKTRPADAWSWTSSLEKTNLILLLYCVWPVSRFDSSSLPMINIGTAVER